jgi:transcriptional regulator with XRE-family HTH domain
MAGYHQAHDSEELKDARKDAGAWLKDLRKDAGITQLDVAKACGYEYVTFISQIESGKGRIPPEKYETFAKVYNVDPKWFMKKYLQFTDPYAFKLLFRFGSND